MNCLEKYRSKLIRETNRNLKIILASPEELAVHEYRVGIKRLTALYYFLNKIKPELQAKKILKPYRKLFKLSGKIRDGHIALHLIEDLNAPSDASHQKLLRAVRNKIARDTRSFESWHQSSTQTSIKVPTIRATGISEHAILINKQIILAELLTQLSNTAGRINATEWHKKRILLKRYQHIMDAFEFCPGHQSDETELKQIYMLQKLLGDWHDRITTISLLQTFLHIQSHTDPVITHLKKQDSVLLGSAKIYLNKYSHWHASQQT